MKRGALIVSVGFLLSSFCLNLGGVRILPPFIGLLIMLLGESKIRNFDSGPCARPFSIVLRINAIVSMLGSAIHLSEYAADSPLAFALPALSYFYYACFAMNAAQMLLYCGQSDRILKQDERSLSALSVFGWVTGIAYAISQMLLLADRIIGSTGFSKILLLSDPICNTLLLLFLLLFTGFVKNEKPED